MLLLESVKTIPTFDRTIIESDEPIKPIESIYFGMENVIKEYLLKLK